MGSKEKRRVVRDLCNSQRVDLVLLQETKLELMSPAVLKEVSSFRETGWFSLPSSGRARGILIFWNKSRVDAVGSDVGRFSLSVLAHFKGDTRCWMVSCVYGPTNSALFPDFLIKLERIQRGHNFPWCIGGDFNEVLSVNDRFGGGKRTRAMELFGNFIDRLGLLDIVTSGPRFTWSNFQVTPAMSKLNRFLISVEWDDLFNPEFALTHQDRFFTSR